VAGTQFGRRDLIKGAAAFSGTALLGLGGSGCGAAALVAAGPFLEQVAVAVVAGLILDHADEAVGVLASAYDQLQRFDESKATQTIVAVSPIIEDVAEIRGLVAGNFVVNEKAHSRAVHVQGSGSIELPSVVTLGLALFAKRRIEVATAGLDQPSADEARGMVAAQLRNELQVNILSVVSGEDSLGTKVLYRAITADDRNLEIEWEPTESYTEQSRLTIRRGYVLRGKDPVWEEDSTVEIGIPYYKLWGPVGSTSEEVLQNLPDT
jgi:hypothetical protein